jgi:hypothetical protein
MNADTHVRCRDCQLILPGWLRVQNQPDAALLLHHLGVRHPTGAQAYLNRIGGHEDIDAVVMEAFERLEA